MHIELGYEQRVAKRVFEKFANSRKLLNSAIMLYGVITSPLLPFCFTLLDSLLSPLVLQGVDSTLLVPPLYQASAFAPLCLVFCLRFFSTLLTLVWNNETTSAALDVLNLSKLCKKSHS